MIVYTLWHLYCWKIQGIPAYPFLKEFRNQSFEVPFYVAGALLVCGVCFLLL